MCENRMQNRRGTMAASIASPACRSELNGRRVLVHTVDDPRRFGRRFPVTAPLDLDHIYDS